MNCKYCNEPLEEGCTVCPACGKEQEVAAEETAEVTCSCEEAAVETEETVSVPEEVTEETAEQLLQFIK